MGKQHNQGQTGQVLKELGELKSLMIRETGSSYSGQLKTFEENQQQFEKRLQHFRQELDKLIQHGETIDIDGKIASVNSTITKVQVSIDETIKKQRDDLIELRTSVAADKHNTHRLFFSAFNHDLVAKILGWVVALLAAAVLSLVIYCWSKLDGSLDGINKKLDEANETSKKSESALIAHVVGETNARRDFEIRMTSEFQALDSRVRDRLPNAPNQAQPVIQRKTN